MITSQNMWPANDRTCIASYSLPGGGKVALRKGDVSVVLLWVANEFHRRVEPLEWPGNWGYAERPVRGSATTLSNHASGTAIDLNAPQHPLGKRGTFTDAQVREIRQILGFCEGVIRWGGDYKSRADEMHFEVNVGSDAVRRIADKIRALQNPQAAKAAPPVEDEMSQEQVDQIRRDLGFARDQIMTHLGKNPTSQPLPAAQLQGVEVARRVDVGYARDQVLDELALHRELLAVIAAKLGITIDAPGGQS